MFSQARKIYPKIIILNFTVFYLGYFENYIFPEITMTVSVFLIFSRE